MNTKQEIVDAMNGENKGSAPPALFSQTGTTELMSLCGSKWPEANFTEDALIRLALQPSERLGFATARIPFDLTSEAERLGCEVREGNGNIQPSVAGSPWRSETLLEPPEFMPVDEFLSEGRCSMYVHAAERISKERPELFLTSCINGPLEVAQFLVGAENFIMGLFMDPEIATAWVDRVTPYQCEYARAMSEVSDNIFVITEAAEDILPPDYFPMFAPFEKKTYDEIKESFSTTHVCGETSNVIDGLIDLGANALSVESFDDQEGMVERYGDKVVLVGGVNPISVLMQGPPDKVRETAIRSAKAGYPIIAPECGVPPQTTNANLEALAKYRL